MPFDLNDPCQSDEAICSQVYEWTDSQQAANSADLVVGTPLVLAGLFVLLVIVRWVLHRMIDRVVRRAEGGVLPEGMGRLARLRTRGKAAGETNHARDLAATTRRAQRSKTIGDLFKSIVTGVLVAIIGTMMLARSASTSLRSSPAPASSASPSVSARSPWSRTSSAACS